LLGQFAVHAPSRVHSDWERLDCDKKEDFRDGESEVDGVSCGGLLLLLVIVVVVRNKTLHSSHSSHEHVSSPLPATLRSTHASSLPSRAGPFGVLIRHS
jgi:hypothetical protein